MRIATLSILSSALYFGLASSASNAAEEAIDCDLEPTEMAIDYGDIVACAIDVVADSDLFFFAGGTGDTVRIEVARVPQFSFFEPCLELIDSGGATIAEACLPAASNRIQLDLPKTDNYEIVVDDRSTNGTGQYHLALERLGRPTPKATPIKYGDNVMDRIDLVADSDPYVFSGSRGDTVRAEVARVGNFVFFEPCIEIFDSAGAALAIGCLPAASNRIDLVLPQKGDFTLLVSDRATNGFGDYDLTLLCLAGACRSAPKCRGATATLVGTAGDNIIWGTSGRDVIVGLDGNDIIYGLGGRDLVCGGNGDDTIYGGGSRDVLYGQNGSDVIIGNSGADALRGGNGNDVLLGESGNDSLLGQSGNDTLDGGFDDDRLNGGGGHDVCSGDQGTDTHTGGCELEVDIP